MLNKIVSFINFWHQLFFFLNPYINDKKMVCWEKFYVHWFLFLERNKDFRFL